MVCWVVQVFGWNLYEFEANGDSLTKVVQEQINEETQLLMEQCAREIFGKQMKPKFAAFAMDLFKRTWGYLINVHLSPEWLTTLEKRLHRLKKHKFIHNTSHIIKKILTCYL